MTGSPLAPLYEKLEDAGYHSEILAEHPYLKGQSAFTGAANKLLDLFDMEPEDAQLAVSAVIDSIRSADKTQKKVMGCGKHGLGAKRAVQFNDDLAKIKLGAGK